MFHLNVNLKGKKTKKSTKILHIDLCRPVRPMMLITIEAVYEFNS